MNAPTNYSDWVSLLGKFETKSPDDQVVVEAMKQGTIEWQSGVAERFVDRFVSTINKRLNNATDKFQKEIGRANGGEYILTQAILSLRKELGLLWDAVDIPALPDRYRQQVRDMVRKQADNVQSSLEDSAKRDRSGKLSSIIRNQRVNNF